MKKNQQIFYAALAIRFSVTKHKYFYRLCDEYTKKTIYNVQYFRRHLTVPCRVNTFAPNVKNDFFL